MQDLREQVLWAGAGVACYLAAALVFLWVVLQSGLLATTQSTWSLSTTDGIGLGISIVLFVFGGYAMRRGRRAAMARPEESALPPQYRSGPQPTESKSNTTDSRPNVEKIVGETTTGTTDAIRCPNCGAPNDPAYTFCQECSTNLSE